MSCIAKGACLNGVNFKQMFASLMHKFAMVIQLEDDKMKRLPRLIEEEHRQKVARRLLPHRKQAVAHPPPMMIFFVEPKFSTVDRETFERRNEA